MSRQANRRSRSLRQQRRKGHKAAGYVRGRAPDRMEKACEASLSCGWRDSNSHAVRHQILSLACLPFQHTRKIERKDSNYSETFAASFSALRLSRSARRCSARVSAAPAQGCSSSQAVCWAVSAARASSAAAFKAASTS